MSGITHAMAACLAGARDWRRVTVGNAGGGGRFGFSTGLAYGSLNFTSYLGASILILTSQGTPNQNFEVVISGIRPMNFFTAVEVLLSNGQSRFFYTDPTKGLSAFNQNVGVPSTQWDWSGLPVDYTWTVADVGKPLGVNLLT